MFILAWRNLRKERVRLIVSVAGVAFAVLLIVLLRGVFVAYQSKIADYYEGIGTDAWVVQHGTPDFVHAFSLVPDDQRAVVARIDGVATVRPYLARQVGFQLHGRDVLVDLVGFDPADAVTGPRTMQSGNRNVGANGIVIDTVFAQQQGVRVGDTLVLNGVSLRVTGISSGGDMVMYQNAYAALPTARQILNMPAADQALLVSLAPGTQLADVAPRILAAVPDSSVYSTAELVARNQRPLNESFVPIIGVLLVIGFLVGVTVIGLTTYSAVLEKRREYGVLKSVGASASQMLQVVLIQAAIAAAIGYAVGVGLAYLIGSAAARWVPQFVTKILPTDLGWVGVAALAMAVVASAIPLLRISRIDPVEVFRA